MRIADDHLKTRIGSGACFPLQFSMRIVPTAGVPRRYAATCTAGTATSEWVPPQTVTGRTTHGWVCCAVQTCLPLAASRAVAIALFG